jgi:hypothetical protein
MQSRAAFNRFGHVIENLEPVNDEMRKKPFTVPTVTVSITVDNPMDNSTVKTRQSQISYVD